jgi:hypothetical protein
VQMEIMNLGSVHILIKCLLLGELSLEENRLFCVNYTLRNKTTFLL